MLELNALRKNKINLSDYNSQQDIQNRMVIADFSPFDVLVLEEILFSPLKISLKKLAKTLDAQESDTALILSKLVRTNLLTLEEDSIVVDKEMRKYFEFQIQRFDPEFKPDLEFLQGLLRKVPIHILPIWYSIPRSSNNIFESIIEKHLLTPQLFQRYLSDLHFEPSLQGIIDDLYAAPDFRLSSSDVISKYNLSRRDFEEIALIFEYNFICTVRYIKEDDHWHEIITPFYEWHQYLQFLRENNILAIENPSSVLRLRKRDFAFVEDVACILRSLLKMPCKVGDEAISLFCSLCDISLQTVEERSFAKRYFTHLIDKICLLNLAEQVDGKLHALSSASEWIELSVENRSLYFYRHPLNQILSFPIPPHLSIEKNLREAEKSVRRVLHGGWFFFDDFIKGVLIAFNEDSVTPLKKAGKQWRYSLPSYSDVEKDFIKASIFELLFECGIVATGTMEGRDCFSVTPFGRFVFAE